MLTLDIDFMKEALNQAKLAKKNGDVPVGCVIVKDNKIIAKAYNNTKAKHNPFGHAEMIAIEKAAKALNNFRLENCSIYITLEPCLMCAGAILNTHINRVVYALENKKTGVLGSVVNVFHMDIVGHMPSIKRGVLKDEAKKLLADFFADVR